jgi:hypothetical protein
MTTETRTDTSWSERDWDYLLDDLKDGEVIPIVGEELYTIPRPGGGEMPLYHAAAEKLSSHLRLKLTPGEEQARPLNEVVYSYLRDEKERGEEADLGRVYSRFCDIIKDLNPQPSGSLQNLAAITDFKLLVTTAPDDLLERALNQKRFGGVNGTTSLAFTLKESREDLPREYQPGHANATEPPVVFHLFGRLAKRLDQFVLSDDDLLEFFLALQSLRSDQLPNLRDALEQNHLLFLGGSMSDWLVRFFLRTANRRRLSEKKHYDVLAADGAYRNPELLKFLKFFSPRTKLAPYSAADFTAELHRRWRESRPAESESMAPVLPRIEPPDRLPEGGVFLSYASEDREAVRTLKAHLDAAGIAVWFDRDQLMSGHDWNQEILRNLNSCSFFIPIISSNTQRILRNAYFRKEWNLADEIARSSHSGVEFVLPVLLEDLQETLAVPETFMRKQGIVAPQGNPPEGFVKRLKELVDQRKANPLRR